MICNPIWPGAHKDNDRGEAPGEQEAKSGVPFVGESGKELTRVLF